MPEEAPVTGHAHAAPSGDGLPRHPEPGEEPLSYELPDPYALGGADADPSPYSRGSGRSARQKQRAKAKLPVRRRPSAPQHAAPAEASDEAAPASSGTSAPAESSDSPSEGPRFSPATRAASDVADVPSPSPEPSDGPRNPSSREVVTGDALASRPSAHRKKREAKGADLGSLVAASGETTPAKPFELAPDSPYARPSSKGASGSGRKKGMSKAEVTSARVAERRGRLRVVPDLPASDERRASVEAEGAPLGQEAPRAFSAGSQEATTGRERTGRRTEAGAPASSRESRAARSGTAPTPRAPAGASPAGPSTRGAAEGVELGADDTLADPAGGRPSGKKWRAPKVHRRLDDERELRQVARAERQARARAEKEATKEQRRARRRVRLAQTLVSLAASIVVMGISIGMLYFPAQEFYLAIRENERLAEELAANEARNEQMQTRIDNLQTAEGIEDEARARFGLVMPGESTATVVGLDDDVSSSSDFATPPEVERGSGTNTNTWVTDLADRIFGVSTSTGMEEESSGATDDEATVSDETSSEESTDAASTEENATDADTANPDADIVVQSDVVMEEAVS